MIKVLIIEDSITAQNLISSILVTDPDIKVIGTARDGVEALRILQVSKPDVITMDLYMPKMHGVEVTRQIMETQPVPIVIVSSYWEATNKELAFQCVDAGAVAMVEKPQGLRRDQYEESAKRLIQTVKSMSEVKLVKRRRPHSLKSQEGGIGESSQTIVELVAIGASTGGPPILRDILSGITPDFPVPIVIVQHIAHGFLEGMVDWLSNLVTVDIHVAEQGMVLLPGHVYFGPDDWQISISRQKRVVLTKDKPEHGLRPSISYLFRALANTYDDSVLGVLLTGMGVDGAREMKTMKERGAKTIAQDEQTSVIFGMPAEAIRLGGVSYVLPAEQIGPMITSLVKVPSKQFYGQS
jgi:two-component system chemotaxis response regulator CheB